MLTPFVLPPRPDRLPLIREAFRLEWLTIGWMTIKAVGSIGAGFSAGSLVVLAFGLGSLIELASAGFGWLSFVVIISLAAQWLTGAWWIDSVGSPAIVCFLIKEGREAWSSGACCCC